MDIELFISTAGMAGKIMHKVVTATLAFRLSHFIHLGEVAFSFDLVETLSVKTQRMLRFGFGMRNFLHDARRY